MGDLGDVLELLADSEARWKTLRAAGREWHHTPRQSEIAERRLAEMLASHPRGSVATLTGYVPDGHQPPIPDETEDPWRLWMQGRGRKRVERSAWGETITVVVDAPVWWNWSPRTGGRTNHGAKNHSVGVGPAAALLDTPPLLSALRLEFLGTGVLLGRKVFLLRGLPRARTGHGPEPLQELGMDADDYLLSVDAERGILLRSEARLRKQPFLVIEVLEVEFDADLPDETFILRLPPGESFEDVSQRPRPGSPMWSKLFPRASQRRGSLPRRR